MVVKLHYLNQSRASRVLWLLEELGIPYEAVIYHRNPKTHLAPPELAKVHPSGNSPLIEDDGHVIAESGLILEYLVEKYGKDSDLIWKNEDEEITIKYALHAAESNLMITGMMLAVHRIAAQRLPWGLSALARNVFAHVDSYYAAGQFDKVLINLQNQFEQNNGFYCNGRLTVADIMYSGSIEPLMSSGVVLQDLPTKYPAINKWLKMINDTPSKTRANIKAKQYDTKL